MGSARGFRVLVLVGLALAALVLAQSFGGRNEPTCSVDPVTLTTQDCRLVSSDPGTTRRPDALWGTLACAARERHRRVRTGGDRHPDATGMPLREGSYRRLVIREGDDFFGQRCELGRNEHRFGQSGGPGTFHLYREGERSITFVSYKLLPSTPVESRDNYAVLQMKQTQPSDNGGYSPILSLNVHDGEWVLRRLDSPGDGSDARGEDLWRAPARRGAWTRVALDVTYSQSASAGRVAFYIDLNGDGDARDSHEQSPTFRVPTLKYEIPDSAGQAGDEDGLAPGASIPGHLRVGLYQSPAVDCAKGRWTACAIAVDNVQVVSPE